MKMDATFQSRDFKQIIQKSTEPFRLVGDASQKFVPRVLVQAVPVAAQGGGGPRNGCQGRPNVVRHGAQQRRAHGFGFDARFALSRNCFL